MKDGDRQDRRKRRSTSHPAADDGRSGYGSESVRPYLRAQLRLKELMQSPQLGLQPAKAGSKR